MSESCWSHAGVMLRICGGARTAPGYACRAGGCRNTLRRCTGIGKFGSPAEESTERRNNNLGIFVHFFEKFRARERKYIYLCNKFIKKETRVKSELTLRRTISTLIISVFACQTQRCAFTRQAPMTPFFSPITPCTYPKHTGQTRISALAAECMASPLTNSHTYIITFPSRCRT